MTATWFGTCPPGNLLIWLLLKRYLAIIRLWPSPTAQALEPPTMSRQKRRFGTRNRPQKYTPRIHIYLTELLMPVKLLPQRAYTQYTQWITCGDSRRHAPRVLKHSNARGAVLSREKCSRPSASSVFARCSRTMLVCRASFNRTN